ncbi:hypothetical protein KJ877_03025 [bacterium]|nr:hypothetical protein [bacterium]MBU1990179.1 hypothetical protein [bacterium]
MMNNANEISRKTKLYGYIGENAGVSRFSAILNKMFKSNGDDAMIIPMNIRKDDFYFTLSNMKKSHVEGAVISNEFVCDVPEILDEASSMVKRSGMCDIVFREGEKLRGDIYGTRVLSEHLKDMGVAKIAMIGTSPHARAFSFLACGFHISFFNDNLEELMRFTQDVELKDADINRLAKGMHVDLSQYDALLDFSDMQSLDMIVVLPGLNLDMKNEKEFSALGARARELGASYTSYDDILEKLTNRAYKAIKGK